MERKINIKVCGQLDKKWKDWFEGMDITYHGNDTILSGYVKDDAFLHGILNRIRDLNLKLISVISLDEVYTKKQTNKESQL